MREAALGGPDTCTREKTVWQVKLLRAADPDTPLTCLSEIGPWKTLTATADGRLAARAEASIPPKTPCQLPPEAGYRLLENHLYRVEIHDDGTITGKARYKWSRDNGSILSRVVRWLDDPIANEFEVANIGRDDVLAISAGCWPRSSGRRGACRQASNGQSAFSRHRLLDPENRHSLAGQKNLGEIARNSH